MRRFSIPNYIRIDQANRRILYWLMVNKLKIKHKTCIKGYNDPCKENLLVSRVDDSVRIRQLSFSEKIRNVEIISYSLLRTKWYNVNGYVCSEHELFIYVSCILSSIKKKRYKPIYYDWKYFLYFLIGKF